ncbi:Forkhead-associated protein [Cyanobacterium stanieri PCC 7202]|uniref:Forkhead-associated protein n=1 Tax=Cyanobacterium stanieri (strain ATCC 29140 / PCC 7202) TaxID=292563 RepID=K9YHC4_CYASC|nr:Forkhead-associated protein [Cyanobacterium stanieri PCC 7202]
MIPIICSTCGYSNQEDSKFCTFCGQDLSSLQNNFESKQSSKQEGKQEMVFPEDESITEINSEENYIKYLINHSSELPEESRGYDDDDVPTVANWNIPTELNTAIDEDSFGSRTVLDVRVSKSSNQKKLVLIHPETEQKFILAEDKKIFYCGRYNDDFSVDIDFSDLPHSDIVSRVHFIIHIDSDTYFLEDAGSSNGTFVNGQVVKSGYIHRQKITVGDEIILGRKTPLKLLFEQIS